MPQARLLKAFSLTFFLPTVAFFIILNDSWLTSIDSSIPSNDLCIPSGDFCIPPGDFWIPPGDFWIFDDDLPIIYNVYCIPSDDSVITSSEWSPVILFLLLLIDSHIIHFHGLWEGVCVNTLNTPPCPANGDI